jgi:hypothetical protein
MSISKEDLWNVIVKQNPEFKRPTGQDPTEYGQFPIHFSVKGLRKFFDLVYEKAHDRGIENGKALAVKEQTKSTRVNDKDIFNSAFSNAFGFGKDK